MARTPPTTLARDQRTARNWITSIAVGGLLALMMLVAMATAGLATASAAEAAYVPTRYAHPVHGKRPMSAICWAFGVCKTERLCYRGNPNIVYKNPGAQKLFCIKYKY